MVQLSEMDTDAGLAIGALIMTFGLGMVCMITIVCRTRCVDELQEVVATEVQEEDDYIIIAQEPLQPQ